MDDRAFRAPGGGRRVSSAYSAARAAKALHDYLLSYALLALLAALILLWTAAVLLVLSWWPRRKRRAAVRASICYGLRIYTAALTSSGAYRLDLTALDTLDAREPMILAPNHPTLIDAFLILSRHPNLTCVLKPDLLNNALLGIGARLAGYLRGHPPRRLVKEALAELAAGGVLLLFPEGTRSERAPVNPLKGSVGVIAKHAGVPVQAILIETDSPYLSKGWPLLRVPRLPITCRVRLGPRLLAATAADATTQELAAIFARELHRGVQPESQAKVEDLAGPELAEFR